MHKLHGEVRQLHSGRRGRALGRLRPDQGGWVQLIYFVVSLIITIVLSPKPPTPKPATIDDFKVPTAEEDRFIPWLFGKARITGENCVWYGDLTSKKIRKSSMFSSQTVGFRYFLGMHLVLGYTFDRILGIDIGDKEAWTGNVATDSTINIDQHDLFGGDKQEGGFAAKVDVCFGLSSQARNPYLLSKIGLPLSAFRGVCGLVIRGYNSGGAGTLNPKYGGFGGGAYVGTTPYVKPIAVIGARVLADWEGGTWYPEAATIGDYSMNAAHIFYQVLTDSERGQSTPSGMLDDASFRAFADLCVDEGLGLNLLWNNATTCEAFLQIVADHAAALLVYDVYEAKYKVIAIRGDYDVEALPSFDPSNAKACSNFTRRSWGETVNELTITATDPQTYKATGIIVQDLGNIRSQKARIPDKIDRSGVSDEALLKVIAGRELASRSTPLCRCSLDMNRIAADRLPGECIKLTWPEYGLATTVMRIINMRKSPLGSQFIQLDVVEDIYALSGIEYTSRPVPPEDPDLPDIPADGPDSSGTILTSTEDYPPSITMRIDGERHLVPLDVPSDSEWYGHGGQIAEWDLDNEEWVYLDVPNGSVVHDDETGGQIVIYYGAPSPVPYTPAIPIVADYPGLVIDDEDVLLVGYSQGALTYYRFSASMLPTAGATITVTDMVTTVDFVSFIGLVDAVVTDLGGGHISIKVSPLTAKGDLYTRTSTAVARQAAGPDGALIKYDSSTPTGLSYTTGSKYGEPITNGDATDPLIVFADGDFVFVSRDLHA